jgi:tetratricopeptide (TPR) repeat protein
MKEISSFEKKFAHDPNVQLTLIDLYILRREYDKALNSINQVDAVINKDPFLNYYRGLMNYAKGDKEKAMAYYLQVAASNPTFPGVYTELVALYADKDDTQNARFYFSKYKALRNSDDKVINMYELAYPYLKD